MEDLIELRVRPTAPQGATEQREPKENTKGNGIWILYDDIRCDDILLRAIGTNFESIVTLTPSNRSFEVRRTSKERYQDIIS